MQYFKRISSRRADREEPADLATRDAQLDAIARWGIPDPSKLTRLQAITQPTLVANGDNDTMMITENSYLLAHDIGSTRTRVTGSSTSTPNCSPTRSMRSQRWLKERLIQYPALG